MRATLALTIVLFGGAVGCASGFKPYDPIDHTKRTIFMPSVRAVGPVPVYARTYETTRQGVYGMSRI